MSSQPTSIDIRTIPGLDRVVDEMKRSNQPHILQQDSEPVAMLIPMEKAAQLHKTLEIFDFRPLAEIKTSFLEAGYSKAEVTEMLDALAELPQYASTGQNIR